MPPIVHVCTCLCMCVYVCLGPLISAVVTLGPHLIVVPDVCMCTCMCACMICVYNVHAYTRVHVYRCMHVCEYVRACMRACMHVCIPAIVSVYNAIVCVYSFLCVQVSVYTILYTFFCVWNCLCIHFLCDVFMLYHLSMCTIRRLYVLYIIQFTVCTFSVSNCLCCRIICVYECLFIQCITILSVCVIFCVYKCLTVCTFF